MANISQLFYWPIRFVSHVTDYLMSCDLSVSHMTYHVISSFLQCDLASEGFLGNVNQLDEYCRDKGFHAWFETSAKENIGIDEAARCLVAKVCGLAVMDGGL